MNLEARVRVVVRVPFKADVDELPDYPSPSKGRRWSELSEDERHDLTKARAEHAKAAKASEAGRIAAAKHAQTKIADQVKAAFGKAGEVVDVLVEEVSEA